MFGLFVWADVTPPTPLLTGLAPVSPPPDPGSEKRFVPGKPAQSVILIWKDERPAAQANPLVPCGPGCHSAGSLTVAASAPDRLPSRGFPRYGKSSTLPSLGKAGHGMAGSGSPGILPASSFPCKREPGASRPPAILNRSESPLAWGRGEEGNSIPLFPRSRANGNPELVAPRHPHLMGVPTCVGTRGGGGLNPPFPRSRANGNPELVDPCYAQPIEVLTSVRTKGRS